MNFRVMPQEMAPKLAQSPSMVLGCSVGFVRINGDRINGGLFHLIINGVGVLLGMK